MAYQVLKSGRTGWRLIERVFIDGVRKAKAIPKEAYRSLGFNESMTFESAKDRAKQLSSQALVETRRRVKAASRIEHQALVNSAFLPSGIVKDFEDHLKDLTTGMTGRLDTIIKHWSTIQKLIVELEIDPKDFYTNRYKIYKLFMERQYSLDYTGKLLRILNLWGHHCSRITNSFFQPVPKPNMNEQQRFIEAREDKEGVRKEAKPLDNTVLYHAKTTFDNNGLSEQWNWLFIATWFGLRPSEVDNLKNIRFWRVEKSQGINILMVYQTKLTSVSKDKRWKPIPIYFDEQKEALSLIKQNEFKRPTPKTVAKYLGEGLDNYSPRKGFTDLLLQRGFALEDISVFLGHSSIDTTWKHYKNKMTFKLPG